MHAGWIEYRVQSRECSVPVPPSKHSQRSDVGRVYDLNQAARTSSECHNAQTLRLAGTFRDARLTSYERRSGSAADVGKLPGVERCAADQTTVDVRLREEIVGVSRIDAAAIEDAHPLGER